MTAVVVCACDRAPWLPPCEHVRDQLAAEPWRRIEFLAPPPRPDVDDTDLEDQ